MTGSEPLLPPDDLAEVPTLLLTLTGPDRPGVSAAVFGVLAEHDVVVLDVEQVVVRGLITLAALVTGDGSTSSRVEVEQAVRDAAAGLGLDLTVHSGQGDNRPRPTNRLAVVVLGSPLTASAVSAVTGAFVEEGANIDRIRRLSRWPVTTLEYDISGADLTRLRTVLAGISVAHGIDIAVAPGGLSRRGQRLVVMDVDSTLIRDEVIELLARHAGREAEVAAVTERAMRGELDFAESLAARVATLAGLPVSVLDAVRAAVRLTPGARTLVRTLHRLGFKVALVSGGFHEVVDPLAATLGIEYVRANRLEVADGRLTGRTTGPVVDRPGKAAALRDFARLDGIPLSRTVAIGDGANDLDMLALAGLGIAFNAKPLVRDQADAAVNVPYLDSVLFLLGISREEVEDADAPDRQAAGAGLAH